MHRSHTSIHVLKLELYLRSGAVGDQPEQKPACWLSCGAESFSKLPISLEHCIFELHVLKMPILGVTFHHCQVNLGQGLHGEVTL